MQDKARNADTQALGIEKIAARVFATDWATLGAHVLEAATMATAKHQAMDARRDAPNGSVVEPPKPGVPRTM